MLQDKSFKTRGTTLKKFVQNDSFGSLKGVLWQVFAILLVACESATAHAKIVKNGWLHGGAVNWQSSLRPSDGFEPSDFEQFFDTVLIDRDTCLFQTKIGLERVIRD